MHEGAGLGERETAVQEADGDQEDRSGEVLSAFVLQLFITITVCPGRIHGSPSSR